MDAEYDLEVAIARAIGRKNEANARPELMGYTAKVTDRGIVVTDTDTGDVFLVTAHRDAV